MSGPSSASGLRRRVLVGGAIAVLLAAMAGVAWRQSAAPRASAPAASSAEAAASRPGAVGIADRTGAPVGAASAASAVAAAGAASAAAETERIRQTLIRSAEIAHDNWIANTPPAERERQHAEAMKEFEAAQNEARLRKAIAEQSKGAAAGR